ncbi:hypothetical protein LOY94_006745 [Ophidiomyces ophidiicola]|nr:hypothetical protein LOZ62_004650 [Ophidiomyces ophidiicola]KAI1962178.1 hypothetical protein LOZ56_006645 [Ophidiomyces ophidiicola]KAI2088038.1 hypothetical protein LOZ33_006433 [Ophidiomyces ophidiicola]KAI2175228.1 hypothetical protein LOZ22_005584 [Ophidiomyces ophidiicola]KAI2184675.1 hypothetical protein LOZ21_004158 [Ophidiomyces ophidiicola]
MVTKILREMAEEDGNCNINFAKFRQKLDEQPFAPSQRSMLALRMELLQSFLDTDPKPMGKRAARNTGSNRKANEIWNFEKGSITIVDLSCPFVSTGDACALFNICLGIFLDGRRLGNRIVALDEAHKFLAATSDEALVLTETLLSIIRQQRHLGTRVIIATQEPAISPKLLDLCDVSIVHRFTSPAWYKVLETHLAGAVVGVSREEQSKFDVNNLFAKIVMLETGEALVFSANGVFDVCKSRTEDQTCENDGDGTRAGYVLVKLGPRYIRLRMRARLSADGGRSILAK